LTCAAAQAGSRGKRATGTFSNTAPVQIPFPQSKKDPPPDGGGSFLAQKEGFELKASIPMELF